MSNKNATVQYINVKHVVPDPEQPRKYFNATKLASLRVSIKRDGILNPLILEPVKDSDKYSIIDGERRFRAALEEGFKEVPFIALKPKDNVDKLLQQFQIQEMHEGWTAVEKALALLRLSEEMGQTIREICEMLGIQERQARTYEAFAQILDKTTYVKSEIPLDYVDAFKGIKTVARRVKNEILKEPFERSDEKAIERALISRVKEGSIRKAKDFTKIKDAIVKDPKYLEKFIETSISPEAMFYQSKAQGAYHLRNFILSASYVSTHITQFQTTMDIKLNDSQIKTLKMAEKKIKELLNQIGE